MVRTISIGQLKKAGACPGQRAILKSLIGTRKVRVTEAAVLALAEQLNWDWAANHLLSPKQQRVFTQQMRSVEHSQDWFNSIYNRTKAKIEPAYREERIDPLTQLRYHTTAQEYYTMRYYLSNGLYSAVRKNKAVAFALAYNSPKR